VFGLRFAPIGEMRSELHGAEEVECTIRATYSKEGPPCIELIEARGDGLFSLRRGEGVHHLGVWAGDYRSYEAGEPGKCLPVSVTVNVAPGEPTMWLSDPADLHGTRIEFVDERQRPTLEAWIRGGGKQ
ncbi:MAG: hypothetical protein ACREQY_17540, partial [Candidatus Binatia bacterium]